VLAFANLLEMWKRAGEEAKKEGKPDMVHLEENIDFFHEYSQMVNQSYNKKWLRPWPCGTTVMVRIAATAYASWEKKASPLNTAAMSGAHYAEGVFDVFSLSIPSL
jgi:hypothetical protein